MEIGPSSKASSYVIFTQGREIFKLYAQLAKSGIVTLVLISVLGGFLIGQAQISDRSASFPFSSLALVLFGVLFLASGSSALNQTQERELDSKMPRTSSRPLPSGKLSFSHALTLVVVSIVVGLFLLFLSDIRLFLLGATAVVLYNGLYTLWWKKHWPFAAVPGAVPGALPILMGYVASKKEVFNPSGVYLFALLFFWQMPHFWVLAVRYKEDYRKGNIPTLPVFFGEQIALDHIFLWSLGYMGVALLAPLFLPVRFLYLMIAIPVIVKLGYELRQYSKTGSKNWIRFFLWVNFSLIFLIAGATLDVWLFRWSH